MEAVVSGPLGGRGLAVLCGWTGGALKHLRKHERLWHDLGWRTCSLDMPIDATFLPETHERSDIIARSKALAFAIKLERANNDPSSLLVPHCFSNGGVFLLLQTLYAIQQANDSIPLSGMIYDSSPSPINFVRPIAAPIVISSAGLPRSELFKKLALHVPHAVGAELKGLVGDQPRPLGLFKNHIQMPLHPNLCLYSDGDTLVTSSSVEAFAAQRTSMGARVTLAKFQNPDSVHCGHYKAHKNEYARHIKEWIDDEFPSELKSKL
ncbi:hypothetical protein TL16_g04699 [Triparma laevis f. inornata]|uniref:Uncharacterized protein n=2 Tax=Triparma laevis TaxID=1534972 RepID=A0A9W7KWZ4_9STRA|nr:hypothetical protein TL16_g04699 [Triparma laevis f. inornata]GMI14853.1 hypothetical protein TrLO_g12327 [Triparma laevis f. longispina]